MSIDIERQMDKVVNNYRKRKERVRARERDIVSPLFFNREMDIKYEGDDSNFNLLKSHMKTSILE